MTSSRQLSASNALRSLVEVDLHVKEEGGATRGAVLGYIMEHIKQVVASEDWGEFVKSGCHAALITEIVLMAGTGSERCQDL